MWSLVVALALTAGGDGSAKKLYEDGEFQAAIKAAETATPKTKNVKELAQLHLVRGLAQLALGQKTKARAAFNDAIRADPTLELDRRIVGPDAVELIDEARSEFPSVVRVEVEGAAAQVKVDGLEMGPPPLTMKLPVGLHTFDARTSDGRTVHEDRAVPAASKITVTLRIAPLNEPARPVAAPVVDPAPPAVTDQKPDVAVAEQPALPTPPPSEPPMRASKAGLIALIPGLALLVTGAIFTGLSAGQYDALRTGRFTAEQADAVTQTGKDFQVASAVFYGIGGVATLTGFVMLQTMKTPVEAPPVSVTFGPGGAAVTLQGRF